MAIYLGVVSHEWNDFFNFRPKYELMRGNYDLRELSEREIKELLPESEFENVNFQYDGRDEEFKTILAKRFVDHSLCFVEFEKFSGLNLQTLVLFFYYNLGFI